MDVKKVAGIWGAGWVSGKLRGGGWNGAGRDGGALGR